MGIGFPPLTGGAAQFMTGLRGAAPAQIGLDRRSWPGPTSSPRRTASGSRPPPYLREMAEKGESFPA